MAIEEICEKLEHLLSARQSASDKVDCAVKALCRVFKVGENEVAMFGYDGRLDCFHFLWPTEMRSSGSIPFSANRSLVSVTAAERRGFMDNSFASTPHLFVFEGFGKDKNTPIQKIMSVPMLKGEELRGVIQLCRKGEEGDCGLASFTGPELSALAELAKVIGRQL